MSFSVSRRTQEFGVRMALGADKRRILSMVLKQGGRQIAVGLGVGLLLVPGITTAGSDAIRNMLFGVSARDPLTYAAVFALVTLVSLVAVLVPAQRATRVHPMIALRPSSSALAWLQRTGTFRAVSSFTQMITLERSCPQSCPICATQFACS